MDTKKLRQKILDLAIRGKLVPQDPADEPASVLLERIKAEKEQLIKEGKIKRSKKTAKTSDTPHYGNVPFEVPDNWVSVPVSELFCLNPKSEIADDTNIGFIPMACVNDGFSGNHHFEKRIWKEVKKGYCHFQNGDIGIAKISPCFENLKSTIFQELPNNCGAGTTELVILRPINIYAKFYLYLFKSQWYIDEGTKYFKGVVGQQRVNKGIFTDLHIPLPPFAEQQRIVMGIEKWFALIDQIEQGKTDLQTTIKQTKSKILDLAIHGKLVPQAPNDEPAIELLKRINPDFTPCDNGHYTFEIPNLWTWCKLGDIAQSNIGLTYKPTDITDNGIPVYRSNNIRDRKIDKSDLVRVNAPILEKQFLNIGDLLICARNGSRRLVGKCAIIEELDEATSFGAFMAVCRSEYNQWIFNLLNTTYFDRYLDDSNSTAINQVTQKMLLALHIPLPPLSEQQRIVQKIEELFSILDNIQNALEV